MSLTGKTGKYQDEVSALPDLPLNRYERIFKLFTEPTMFEQWVTARIFVLDVINFSNSDISNS